MGLGLRLQAGPVLANGWFGRTGLALKNPLLSSDPVEYGAFLP